ncbi:MAG: hypothetical protein CTY31_02750 [Hyphomicrobium sp.]|nr:MAG: hypothetical protein CTY31_02750 [Hyphomicrobium sp.]
MCGKRDARHSFLQEMPEVRLRMMAFTLEVLGPVLRRALIFFQALRSTRRKATRQNLILGISYWITAGGDDGAWHRR